MVLASVNGWHLWGRSKDRKVHGIHSYKETTLLSLLLKQYKIQSAF